MGCMEETQTLWGLSGRGKAWERTKAGPRTVDPEGWEIEYRVSQSGGALRRPGGDGLCLH